MLAVAVVVVEIKTPTLLDMALLAVALVAHQVAQLPFQMVKQGLPIQAVEAVEVLAMAQAVLLAAQAALAS
jgi:hypothetical protein